MGDLRGTTVYFVVGPTASGKGSLARALALDHGMEIVSMDSMKVYRGMDAGTAKPSAADRARVRHHMVDVADPSATFDLASWIAGAEAAILDIARRGLRPLVCGGTGLYLKGFLSGIFEGPPAHAELREALARRAEREGSEALHAELAREDPAAAEKIHPRDRRRVVRALEILHVTGERASAMRTQFGGWRTDVDARLVGIERERGELGRRIEARVARMAAAGFLEEVRSLAALDPPWGLSPSQALGYRELAAHLRGETTLEEALARTVRNTRKFVRRQQTWFRRFPQIRWLSVEGPSDAAPVRGRAAAALGLVPGTEFP